MEKIEDRIRVTENGFNYIKVKYNEVLNWGGFCVCNSCNGQFMFQDMYLVFVLGDCYCEKCFNEWKAKQTKVDEDVLSDLHYQNENENENSLAWYKYHLDDNYRKKIIEENKKEEEEFLESIIDYDDIITDEDLENFLGDEDDKDN